MNNSIFINYNLLLKTTPTFASSVDLDMKKPSDQDLHCLSCSLWIEQKHIKNLLVDQINLHVAIGDATYKLI